MIGVFVPWNDRKNSPGYVINGNGCHIWTGWRDKKGYGMVKEHGRRRYVHRLRYLREIGPIPDGLQLDHFACDNGPGGCCNPLHVRPVTARENLLRGNTIPARNAAKTHCPRGHDLTPKSDGSRQCNVCANERRRTPERRAKGAAAARRRRARKRALNPILPRPKSTHCRRGHPYSEKLNSKGYPWCPTCDRAKKDTPHAKAVQAAAARKRYAKRKANG